MTDWLDVLNPREWARVTWIAIALFAGIRFAGFGGGMIRIVKAPLQPKLIAVFGTATAYSALCVWGLSELGWWNVANLKSTIIWAFTFAFVTMVAIEKCEYALQLDP